MNTYDLGSYTHTIHAEVLAKGRWWYLVFINCNRVLERKSVIIMSRFGIDCSTPARLPPKNVPIMVICVLDRLGGVGGGCGCGVGFINLSFPRCIEIGFNVHTCSHQIA